jgi:hypothetical protein
MQITTLSNRATRQQLLTMLALLAGGLGSMKFLAILIDAGPAKAPWGFLLVFVLPFLAGPLLMHWHPRTGAAVTGIGGAFLAIICAVVVAQNAIEPYFMDYIVVFVGGPVALAVAVLAMTVMRRPRAGIEGVPPAPVVP